MRPLKSVEVDDRSALAMENELFRHEITHLRGRLSAAQLGQRDANGEVRRLQNIVRSHGMDSEGGTAKRAAHDRSRNDLVWFLRRIDSSPAGWLFRRYPGFRTLKDRYLGEGK